jgi:spore coat polysaccharide biosynthesis protein SpsF
MTAVLGIVQARMGSTRLPGKVLHPLAGRSVLGWVVRAARESGVCDALVVATSTLPVDDAVEAECRRLGVDCFRGDADDVLSRFVGALETNPAEAVMRFTADCPLLDPEVVEVVGRVFASVPGLDYLNTSLARTLPRGMDAEMIRADALRAVHTLATGHHRTHVTSYAYTHPDRFRVLGLNVPPDRSHLRLTLDTPEDLRLIETVVSHFGDATANLAKLADWVDAHAELWALNAGVRQKRLEEA